MVLAWVWWAWCLDVVRRNQPWLGVCERVQDGLGLGRMGAVGQGCVWRA